MGYPTGKLDPLKLAVEGGAQTVFRSHAERKYRRTFLPFTHSLGAEAVLQ